MKRIFAVLLSSLMIFLASCAAPSDVLNSGSDDFSNDYMLYRQEHEGEIPQSVLDVLDFMLENYTGGLEKPDIEDISSTDISGQPDDTDYGKDISEDEIRKKIVLALSNLQPGVAFKIDTALFSDKYLYDLIFNDICEDYMIETMRLTQYSCTYYEDVATQKTNVNITFSYAYPIEEMRQMRQQTKQKAEQLVAQLGLKNMSEYDAVYTVNKYLCDTIVYTPGEAPFEPFQHSSYGALVKGDCVCEGYARAARLLLTMAGHDCLYVTGDTTGGPHAWNMVKIDGEYYQLDITWNDVDVCPNEYFLVTDDYMSLSRTWDKNRYPKSADLPYTK